MAEAAGALPGEGLRERKRQQTLARLEEVALRLFAERGFEAVTVDDITAAAEVSRRTFFRYFPTKEDLLFGEQRQSVDRLRRALADRPADEPVLTALRHALLSMADSYEDARERLLRRAKIMAETPSLQGRNLVHQQAGEQAVTELVADWLGVDPARDLRPAVVAAVTVGALRAATASWFAGGGRAHLPTLAAEALDLVDGGLQGGLRPVEGRPARAQGSSRAKRGLSSHRGTRAS